MEQRYKLGTLARLTGFSPAVLRAWERRYGLLKPARSPGRQRIYSEEDLQLLLRVRELMAQGARIGEIALRGRDQLLASTRAGLPGQPGYEGLGGLRAALLEAALNLDGERCERLLDDAFARVSPEAALYEAVLPVAKRLGELWAQGQCTIASEHLFSELAGRRLRQLLAATSPLEPVAIAACFPDEWHELGLLVVSYHLMRRGLGILYLGPALPWRDLEQAYLARRPAAVLLSVTRPAVYAARRGGLLQLIRRYGRQAIWAIGGPGTPEADQEILQAGATLWRNDDWRTRLPELLATALRQGAQRAWPRSG